MSSCDHTECAVCYEQTTKRQTSYVCIDINTDCGRQLWTVRTICPSCTHNLCNYLLSLPNRRVENTSVSIRVSGNKELVDTPITRAELNTITRWLHLDR